MNYEQKYKEALERAKSKIKNDKDHVLYEDDVIEIFPELKESDDERIRKELIKLLRNLFNNYSYFIKDPFYTECINWLEKQDCKDIHLLELKAKAYDDAKERMSYAYNQNRVPIGFMNEIFPNIKLYEKQGEQKSVWHDKNEEPCEDRQVLICLSENYYVDFYHKKDKRFYMFCKPKHYLHEIEKWAYLDDLLEKQGEQKPADKVEAKFKIGDWVVYNRNDHSREVIQIYDIRDNRYYFNDNVHFSWSVKECDEKSHLWSIKEAREGDVLATESGKPFIFKGFLDKLHPNSPVACCGIDNSDNFHVGVSVSMNRWTDGKVYPATKEQRDTLEKAMANAWYKWDVNKKELIKL